MCDIFVLSLFSRVVFDVKTIFFHLVLHSFAYVFFSPLIHVFLNLVPSSLPTKSRSLEYCTVIPTLFYRHLLEGEVPSLSRQHFPCRLLAAQYGTHPPLRTVCTDKYERPNSLRQPEISGLQ